MISFYFVIHSSLFKERERQDTRQSISSGLQVSSFMLPRIFTKNTKYETRKIYCSLLDPHQTVGPKFTGFLGD